MNTRNSLTVEQYCQIMPACIAVLQGRCDVLVALDLLDYDKAHLFVLAAMLGQTDVLNWMRARSFPEAEFIRWISGTYQQDYLADMLMGLNVELCAALPAFLNVAARQDQPYFLFIQQTPSLPDEIGEQYRSYSTLCKALDQDNLAQLQGLITGLNCPLATATDNAILYAAKFECVNCFDWLCQQYPQLLTEGVMQALYQQAAQDENSMVRDWFIKRAILNNTMTAVAKAFLDELSRDFSRLKKWFFCAFNSKALNVVGYMLNHFSPHFIEDKEVTQKVGAYFGRTGELDLYPFVFLTQLRQKQPLHYAPKSAREWEMLRAATVNHKSYLGSLEYALIFCDDVNLYKKLLDRRIKFYCHTMEGFMRLAGYLGAAHLILYWKEHHPDYFTPALCKLLLASRELKPQLPESVLPFFTERASGASPATSLACAPHLFSESEKHRARGYVATTVNLASHF